MCARKDNEEADHIVGHEVEHSTKASEGMTICAVSTLAHKGVNAYNMRKLMSLQGNQTA